MCVIAGPPRTTENRTSFEFSMENIALEQEISPEHQWLVLVGVQNLTRFLTISTGPFVTEIV